MIILNAVSINSFLKRLFHNLLLWTSVCTPWDTCIPPGKWIQPIPHSYQSSCYSPGGIGWIHRCGSSLASETLLSWQHKHSHKDCAKHRWYMNPVHKELMKDFLEMMDWLPQCRIVSACTQNTAMLMYSVDLASLRKHRVWCVCTVSLVHDRKKGHKTCTSTSTHIFS